MRRSGCSRKVGGRLFPRGGVDQTASVEKRPKTRFAMTFAGPRLTKDNNKNNNCFLECFAIIPENIPSPSIQHIRWANPRGRDSVDISSRGSLSDKDKRPTPNSSYPP